MKRIMSREVAVIETMTFWVIASLYLPGFKVQFRSLRDEHWEHD